MPQKWGLKSEHQWPDWKQSGGIRRETSEEAEDATASLGFVRINRTKVCLRPFLPHLLPSLSSVIKYHYYFFDKPSLVPSLQDLPQ